ncbi:hypothetical protein GCM10009804_16460 [Kribbella hippodromi]|uniref:ATP-binding protein n=1 Tax=Kribbella hippodromi TaxID=434347 RepID=A0ABP4NH68_9ACTN
MQANRVTTRRHLSTSPFAAKVADSPKTFEVDERVTHDREGLGRVHSVEPGGVVVDFGGGKMIRIVTPFTKLHPL